VQITLEKKRHVCVGDEIPGRQGNINDHMQVAVPLSFSLCTPCFFSSIVLPHSPSLLLLDFAGSHFFSPNHVNGAARKRSAVTQCNNHAQTAYLIDGGLSRLHLL
jgi:hypothetical protein